MAIKMNLLPWREEQRQAKKKNATIALIGGAILGLILSALIYFYVSNVEKEYISANQKVKTKIAKLEKKLKVKKELISFKEKLNLQIKSVQLLQSKRSVTTRALEHLARSIPDDLYITEFRLEDASIDLQGIAKDDSRVSELMVKLEESPLMKTPQLTYINAGKKLPNNVKEFRLTTRLKLEGDDNEEK